MTEQELATLLIVVPAAAYLLRRAFRTLFAGQGSCGSCDSCPTKTTLSLYELSVKTGKKK